jgi:hypothetical protein
VPANVFSSPIKRPLDQGEEPAPANDLEDTVPVAGLEEPPPSEDALAQPAPTANGKRLLSTFDLVNLLLCCKAHSQAIRFFLKPVPSYFLRPPHDLDHEECLHIPGFIHPFQALDLLDAYPLAYDGFHHYHLFGYDVLASELRQCMLRFVQNNQTLWPVQALQSHLERSPTFRWLYSQRLLPRTDDLHLCAIDCAEFLHLTVFNGQYQPFKALRDVLERPESTKYMALVAWILPMDARSCRLYTNSRTMECIRSMLILNRTGVRQRIQQQSYGFFLRCLPRRQGLAFLDCVLSMAYSNTPQAEPIVWNETYVPCRIANIPDILRSAGPTGLRRFVKESIWHRDLIRTFLRHSIRCGDAEAVRCVIDACGGELMFTAHDSPWFRSMMYDPKRAVAANLFLDALSLYMAWDGLDSGLLPHKFQVPWATYSMYVEYSTRFELPPDQRSNWWVNNAIHTWNTLYATNGLELHTIAMEWVRSGGLMVLIRKWNMYSDMSATCIVVESIACVISLFRLTGSNNIASDRQYVDNALDYMNVMVLKKENCVHDKHTDLVISVALPNLRAYAEKVWQSSHFMQSRRELTHGAEHSSSNVR